MFELRGKKYHAAVVMTDNGTNPTGVCLQDRGILCVWCMAFGMLIEGEWKLGKHYGKKRKSENEIF